MVVIKTGPCFNKLMKEFHEKKSDSILLSFFLGIYWGLPLRGIHNVVWGAVFDVGTDL